MKISHEVREYAKNLQNDKDGEIAKGMKEKADEFTQSGCQMYQKS